MLPLAAECEAVAVVVVGEDPEGAAEEVVAAEDEVAAFEIRLQA